MCERQLAPGALDVSWAGRLDFRTDPLQHVAVLLSLELCRAHNGLTANLQGDKNSIHLKGIVFLFVQRRIINLG